MYNIFIVCLLVLQIIILFLILLKIFKVKNIEDEFVLANATLVKIIDVYYDSILVSKVGELRKQYDLNPESKTNSNRVFTERYNELVKDSSKEIMTSHISNHCLSILLKYYTVESLALTIMSNFKR